MAFRVDPDSLHEDALVLKVTLEYLRPPIWRRLVVPQHWRLDDLHQVLQHAFDWDDSHLHLFEVGPHRFEPPGYDTDIGAEDSTRITVGEVLPRVGSMLVYVYDFGDDWRHVVKVEERRRQPAYGPAVCIGGRRAAPPEDCGGPPGYERLVRAIEGGAGGDEDQEFLEFYEGFDPAAFDAAEISRRLADAFDPRESRARDRGRRSDGITGKKAHAAILALLEDPPANPLVLSEAVGELSPIAARNGCLAALERDAVPLRSGLTLYSLFDHLGSTAGACRRLEAIVSSPDRSIVSRLLALELLSHHAPDAAQRAHEGLSDSDESAMRVMGVRRMIALFEEEGAPKEALAESIRAVPLVQQIDALETIEAARASIGTPMTVLYEPLRRAGLGAKADAWLATRLLEGRRAPTRPGDAAADVLFGACDGAGVFSVTVSTKTPDGNVTITNLIARIDGDVRGGFVSVDHAPKSAERLLDRIRVELAGKSMVVPIGLAIRYARDAVERTERLGLPLPDGALHAFARIAQLGVAAELPPAPGPGIAAPTRGMVEDLLGEPLYESWFFTAGDQLELLREPARSRRRLRAMAGFMACFHDALRQRQSAAIMASLAETLDDGKDPTKSPLVQVMLARSPAIDHGIEIGLSGEPTRAALRERMDTSDSPLPLGRHVAILDFADAAYGALDKLQVRIPSSRRLRESDYERLSLAIAEGFLRGGTATHLEETLREFWALLDSYAGDLARCIHGALMDFRENACGRCPVACHDTPDEPMPEVYLSSGHPVQME